MGGRSIAWVTFLGGLIAALLVVVIVLVVNDDGGGAAAEATPITTQPDSTTATTATGATTTMAAATTVAPVTTATPGTTTPPTTTPPTTAPVTSAPPLCAGLTPDSIPPFATDRTSVIGDLDGDGALDAVTVFRDGGTWYVFVELGYGYATRALVTPFGGVGEPQAASVMNVGAAEELALVNTGFGAAGPVYGVWYFDGACSLQQATLDGVAPFEPYKGIGLFHSEGFSCTDDGITLVNATQPGSDDNVWQVEEVALSWVPGLGDFQTQGANTYLTDRNAALLAAADTGC